MSARKGHVPSQTLFWNLHFGYNYQLQIKKKIEEFQTDKVWDVGGIMVLLLPNEVNNFKIFNKFE